MRYICTSIVATLVLAGMATASTWTVDDDGAADFDNIQDAIDAAADGDEILVYPGTYAPIVVDEKALWIHSLEGPGSTVIDAAGENTRVVFYRMIQTPGSVIEGFTITGGHVTSASWGGGLFVWNDGTVNSELEIIDCIITGNANDHAGTGALAAGAGVWFSTGNYVLSGCVISENVCLGTYVEGAGIGTYSATINITNCTISGNELLGGSGWAEGAGIYNYYTGSFTITDSNICGNFPDQIYGSWTNGGGNYVADECAGSTVWTVDDDAGADFYYIQDAIDAASDGDEILVYPGTYTDTGAAVVDMMGKAVWLHSSDGPETTIIDGEGARRGILCENGETANTLIEGFAITNGYASGNGGGMYNDYSSPTLINCTFTNNNSTSWGGGMYNGNNSSPTLTGCTFENNTSNYGGGMYNVNNSSPTLTNCTFTDNTAGNRGGGMRNNMDSSPTLEGCTFTGNTAYDGGGMFSSSGSPTLNDCMFTNNTATNVGGGMYNSSSGGNCTLTDTTVCGNTPDQIYGGWTDGGGNYVEDECAGATVWTVDDDAGADFYYIQDAIDAASDGDEILVYPGTYTSSQDGFVVNTLGKAVTLRSTDPDDPDTVAQTIIDGELTRRGIACFMGETNSTVISGFTIANCFTSPYDFSGDGVITYSEVNGGGINCLSSNPTIMNCTIRDGLGYPDIWPWPGFPRNLDEFGTTHGGVYYPDLVDPPATREDRGGGSACGYGVGIQLRYSDDAVISNCLIKNNFHPYGMVSGIYITGSGDVSVSDCTISNNNSKSTLIGGGSSPSLTNCIIRDNGGLGISHYGTSTVMTNCLIDGNNGGISTFLSDVSIFNCTVSNNYASGDGGGIRTSKGAAYLSGSTICGNTPDQISGEWTDGGGNTVADTCSGDPTGACCVGTSCSIGTPADCSAAGGTYLGDGSSCSGDPCGSGSNVWTVDDSGGADFYDIQSAVNAASDGDEILVYPGTYTDTGDNVVDMMGKSVWLHSSDGPETTIIDGEGVRRGILCDNGETAKTLIEGFAITNGHDYSGGGMYNNYSSPTLENCTFSGNTTSGLGAGMHNNYSSPTLENCTFTNNTTTATNAADLVGHSKGGGMFNWYSSPTLTNCTFEGNTAVHFGGGMYIYDGNPILTNCTFTNNSAKHGGGLRNSNFANPTLTNCTFTKNTAEFGGGINTGGGGNCTLTDTTVCGNTPDQIYGSWTDGGGNYVADKCAGATVWTVDDDAGADFYYIQDAVDAASDGDEILVYPGRYTDTGDNVVDMMGKSVWLHSSDGPETTIIDGAGVRRGILCDSGETAMTLIEGFTIRDCYATPYAGWSNFRLGGGALIISSPTISNCIFDNNYAEYISDGYGGGLFYGNSATQCDSVFTDCIFTNNTSDDIGGGVFGYNGTPEFVNCTIMGNTSYASGGGMYSGNDTPTLTNCFITNNTAPYGGGIRSDSNLILFSTTVCGNTPDQIYGAWTDGGGNTVADTCSGDPTGACCVDTSCSIGTDADCSAAGGTYLGDGSSCSGDPCSAGNTTWTVDDDGPADFDNIQAAIDAASDGDEILVYAGTYTGTGDQVVNMLGKAVWLHSSDGPNTTTIDGEGARRVLRCVNGESLDTVIDGFTITGGYAQEGGGIYCANSNPTLTNCTISGNTANSGGGIYCSDSSNPTLTDTLLCENSPDAIYGPWTDGGWNLFWDVCNDCNSNGIDDAQDILDGTVTDVDGDGIPDECETDCDGDGTPDPIEIYLGEADDVDDDGHPDNCEPDCNENAIPDDYEIEQGWAEDCNDNLVPDDCDLEDPLFDCNGDGLIDACQELDDALDCDGNGLMDACEILADPSLDCNENGVLDTCDISNGDADDVNGDGIPDECQCLADIDESGSVDVNDVLLVISQWGLIDGSADVNEDGIVNVSDLLAILSAWGPCP